jgi:integrase
MRRGELLALQ